MVELVIMNGLHIGAGGEGCLKMWKVGKVTCNSKAKRHEEFVVGARVFNEGCAGRHDKMARQR